MYPWLTDYNDKNDSICLHLQTIKVVFFITSAICPTTFTKNEKAKYSTEKAKCELTKRKDTKTQLSHIPLNGFPFTLICLTAPDISQ